MTRETVEQVLRAAYEARLRDDLDGVMAHFAPDAEYVQAGAPDAGGMMRTVRGRDAIRDAMATLMDAFPFRGLEIHRILVDGDQAAVHWTARLAGPGGDDVATEILDLVRVSDGRIASFKQFADTALAARLFAR